MFSLAQQRSSAHCVAHSVLAACGYIGILLFCSIAGRVHAQRPIAMDGFQHPGIGKYVPSLPWAGLYTAPPQYAEWWKETADCAGAYLPPSRPDSVQFYYVNTGGFAPTGKVRSRRMAVGATYAVFEQIYISLRHISREITVKHEMMHQILYWSRVSDWEDDARPEFKRCGLELTV